MQTAGKVKERVMRYDSEVNRKDPDLMKRLVFGIQGCGQLTFHDLETRRQACPESGGISIFQAPNHPPMPTLPSSVSIECAGGYEESMEKSRRQKIDTAIHQQVSI